MEEVFKYLAAGGSVTTAICIYYIFKIEPRLRSLELTILQGQKIDVIKLAKELAHAPEMQSRVTDILHDIQNNEQK